MERTVLNMNNLFETFFYQAAHRTVDKKAKPKTKWEPKIIWEPKTKLEQLKNVTPKPKNTWHKGKVERVLGKNEELI